MDEKIKNGEKKYLLVEQASEEQKKKLQAVSKMDKKGNIKTVDATPENKHKFFEINPNDSMLEAFFKKMMEQADSPSHTGFFLVTENLLNKIIRMEHTPEELEASRVKPDEFLKEKEQAKKEEQDKSASSGKGTAGDREEKQTAQAHKQADGKEEKQAFQPLDVSKIDRKELEKLGIKPEDLEPHLKAMSYGHKSPKMIPMNPEMDEGIRTPTKGRVSLEEQPDGTLKPVPHYYQEKPNLDAPLHGVLLPDNIKENLTKTRHAGEVLDLELKPGVKTPCYVSLDKYTNGIEVLPVALMGKINKIKGVEFSEDVSKDFNAGKKVLLEGYTARSGLKKDAYIQINAADRRIDFTYDGLDKNKYAQENKEILRQQKAEKQGQKPGQKDDPAKNMFIPKKIFGVPVPENRQKEWKEALNDPSKRPDVKPCWMKGLVVPGKGEPQNLWVKPNYEAGKMDFTQWKPKQAIAQGAEVKPTAESKVQHAVNTEGKTNEATKHVKEPVQKGQTQPNADQKKKQEEKKTQDQGQRQYRKPANKKGGHKMN